MQMIRNTKQSQMCGPSSVLNTSVWHMCTTELYTRVEICILPSFSDTYSTSRQYASFKLRSPVQATDADARWT